MAWTRTTDPDSVAKLLPAWLGRRMLALKGSFGLLLTTGEVIRLTSILAAWQSQDGTVLLDVHLDHAGVPDGVDLAWRGKHFLGAPVPGAVLATVNLAHVVAAVEFTVAELAEPPGDDATVLPDDLQPDEAVAKTEAVGREA